MACCKCGTCTKMYDMETLRGAYWLNQVHNTVSLLACPCPILVKTLVIIFVPGPYEHTEHLTQVQLLELPLINITIENLKCDTQHWSYSHWSWGPGAPWAPKFESIPALALAVALPRQLGQGTFLLAAIGCLGSTQRDLGTMEKKRGGKSKIIVR